MMCRIIYMVCGALLLLTFACDRNFEEVNTDPNAVTSERFNPGYLLTTAQMQTALYPGEDKGGNMYYCAAFVQHFASLSNVGIFNWHGDKYVLHQGNNDVLWYASYNIGKLVEEVIQLSRDNPDYRNLYHMATIWKALVYHRLTDATASMDDAIERTQKIIDAVKRSNPDCIFLTHGGPINTPEDVKHVLKHTEGLHGFVGASSLERMGVEASLTNLTREFKNIML